MTRSPVEPPRPLLLVVATVHLDSQWRWTIEQTIRDFLPGTLRENFALFESHPHYVLSFEGAFRYMLAQEYYPEAFEELREWCSRGRWIPAGAMLDAPDVNVVAPESLIRHILYGNDFFEREFGCRSRDVFLPDCFGFGHALPSVAAHCGLSSFSSSKLIKWKAPGKIPFDIGRWRGPDGAEVLAVLKPGGYGEGVDEDLSRSEEWARRLQATSDECGVAVGVRYTGTGDRGGSPPVESLDQLEASISSDGPIEVRCAPSHAIQDELPPETRARLPLHDSEILLPTHGTGGWTSQAALKRWNRKNELLGAAAEHAAVVADWLGAVPYPHDRLGQAWLRFLWHQMHDDLPGTSIPGAYDFTWNDQAVAANLFSGVLTDSVTAIATGLDTTSNGLPIVVYNPSSSARRDVIEIRVDRKDLPGDCEYLRVDTPAGTPLEVQVEDSETDRPRLLFAAELSALSFSVFHLLAEDSPGGTAGGQRPQAGILEATTDRLENERYRVTIDAAGDVAGIFDKRLDRELLVAPLRLELLRDRSMRWPAWEIRPETILECTPEPVPGAVSVEVVESGPVRAAVRIEREFRGSRLVQIVQLSNLPPWEGPTEVRPFGGTSRSDGSASDAASDCGHRIDITCELEWRTRGRLLKAAFPLAASNPNALYDLGLGAIERGNNTPERYEVPAQQWASIADSTGEFGVAILNDCRYGWDKPSDDELRLSLARSPSSLRKYPHQRVQDIGPHRFTYSLIGHRGEADLGAVCRQAEHLNRPAEAFAVEPSTGSLGSHLAFLDTGDAAISVTALKKAEHGERCVVRLRETQRQQQSVRMRLAAAVRQAVRLSGTERPRDSDGDVLEPSGALRVDLAPWAIETLGVELAPPAAPMTPEPQVSLGLRFDRRATSLHGENTPGDFDRGASFPGELFPQALSLGGIDFRLGPVDGLNAMSCSGQQIELPTGLGHLWLIGCATGTDTPIRTEVGFEGGAHPLTISPWKGWLARRPSRRRWGGLRPARPGHLNRDDLAWLGTHHHRNSSNGDGVVDAHYAFCHLFRYLVEMPKGSTWIRLPAEPSVFLFAATVAEGAHARARPLRALYGT